MPREVIQHELPPLAEPFLEAMQRLQGREPAVPEQVSKRAASLLVRTFGDAEGAPYQEFAHASLGLLAGHTQYFPGFAVLMGLVQGTAVAIRPARAEGSRLIFEGEAEEWQWERGGDAHRWPVWSCLVRRLVEGADLKEEVEVAVVSTVPPSCIDAYLAALGMACRGALESMKAAAKNDGEAAPRRMIDAVHEATMHCEGSPTSVAYPMAVYAADEHNFTLIDTKTREHLPLEAPPREKVGWGLVTLGQPVLRDARFHREHAARADRALEVLQEGDFPQLVSFRELEHRDLQKALAALPDELKPVVRHLVTENRRVHRLVHAARHNDWQMFGALLMMSHASLRADWDGTNEATDLVVDIVQSMTLEGMYGACITGRGSSVLLVGQPFTIPQCLDRIAHTLDERLGIKANTMLL